MLLLFGYRLGNYHSAVISCGSVLLSLFVSLIIFLEVGLSRATCFVKVYTIFESVYFYVDVSFLFDTITATMLIVVTAISLFVHLFSVEYMNSDPHFIRFMSYLSLFTFFMLLLVTAGNMVQFFVGWEGVGLSSYLLINFWFTRREANKAALKAIIVNRIGDCGLIIVLGLCFYLFGTLDFCSLFSLVKLLDKDSFVYNLTLNLDLFGINLTENSFAVKEMFSAIIYLDFCILVDIEHEHWLEVFYDRLINFWVDIVIIFQYWFWLVSSWWPAWGDMFYDLVGLGCKNTVIDVVYVNGSKSSVFNACEIKFSIDLLLFCCVCIIIAAAAKSAQLGLHTWLVDAMEGPTPVSALIHAATMVTAGVYLLVRVSPILSLCPIALKIVLFLGALTALISSITAVFQVDLKKLIAYSTVSQIGFMFIACGCSSFNGAMFHLSTHAFFKALLFLCAGVVIYALGDEQDMRKMGVLHKYLPFTFLVFIIGSFALSGFPFLSGYYSKDFILEFLFTCNNYFDILCFFMSLCATFFTCLYSWKLAFFVFLIPYNGPRARVSTIKEPGDLMIISLAFLGFGSLFIGYFIKDFFIGAGSDFWNNSLYLNSYFIENLYIPKLIKLFPLISFFYVFYYLCKQRLCDGEVSWIYLTCYTDNLRMRYIDFFDDSFGRWLYDNRWPLKIDWSLVVIYFESLRAINRLLRHREGVFPALYPIREINFFFFKNFLFDFFYNRRIVYPFIRLGYDIIFKTLDRGAVEKAIGPNGVVNYIKRITDKVSKIEDDTVLYAFLTSLYFLVNVLLILQLKVILFAVIFSFYIVML